MHDLAAWSGMLTVPAVWGPRRAHAKKKRVPLLSNTVNLGIGSEGVLGHTKST